MIPSLLPTYNRTPLEFVKGEGAWLSDTAGRRYLDFTSGIAVNSLGHAPPRLVAALSDQAAQLWHVSNLYDIPLQQQLADMLVERSFADTVFFTNSGTESAELAIKMARKYWSAKGESRHKIITFEGAFHGRSTGAIAAAGSEKMTDGFGPLMPGFITVPFGDHAALKAAMDETIAAVMIEPIQGEGGIRPVPDQCLQGLRAACDACGALLIYDEVQCGVGRTGKLFAHEWSGATPDILMSAKGIGGGFPLGAVLATQEAASGMIAGTHGSTYGGNPLGCRVGIEVLRVMEDEHVMDNVAARARQLNQGLLALVDLHPAIFAEVRGMGLLMGVKCACSNMELVAAARATGLLTVPAADNVVRLLPPLTITEDEVAIGLEALANAATQIEEKST